MSKKIVFLVAIGTIFWGSVISGNNMSVDAVKSEKREFIVPKDPLIAGLLSVQCPGLGQIYCRRYSRGVAYLSGEIGCFALALVLAGVEEREYSWEAKNEETGETRKLTTTETISKWKNLSGLEKAGVVGLSLTGVGIHIWNIIDAYRLAQKHNEEQLGWIRFLDVQLGFKDNSPSLKLAVSKKF